MCDANVEIYNLYRAKISDFPYYFGPERDVGPLNLGRINDANI